MILVRGELGAELAQVIIEHHTDRIRAVAVHVDQRIEAALGTGEQPVDGPFLVAFHMVGVELAEEVIADAVIALALDVQRLLDELEVFLVVLIAKGHAQELAEALGDVVGEPVAVQHGDDVVVIGREARLRNPLQVVLDGLTLVSQDQPRLVQRVTAEHAAHGIGDQLAHGVGQQQRLQFRFALVVAVAIVRVAGQGDFIERHLGLQFILQAIALDEDAVILCLQLLHLQRHLPPVDAKFLVSRLQS